MLYLTIYIHIYTNQYGQSTFNQLIPSISQSISFNQSVPSISQSITYSINQYHQSHIPSINIINHTINHNLSISPKFPGGLEPPRWLDLTPQDQAPVSKDAAFKTHHRIRTGFLVPDQWPFTQFPITYQSQTFNHSIIQNEIYYSLEIDSDIIITNRKRIETTPDWWILGFRRRKIFVVQFHAGVLLGVSVREVGVLVVSYTWYYY